MEEAQQSKADTVIHSDQQDERVALASIFGKDFENCAMDKIKLNIPLEPLEAGSKGVSIRCGQSQKMSCIRNLPLLQVVIQMDPTYPEVPPTCSFASTWVQAEGTNLLNALLCDCFQPGDPVIFEWYNVLRYKALETLAACELLVDPDAFKLLKGYDFEVAEHYCAVCMEHVAGKSIEALECDHIICKACLKLFIESCMSSGQMEKCVCVQADCNSMVSLHQIRRLCGDAFADRFEALLLTKTLRSMPDFAECPRCGTQCIAEKPTMGCCPTCDTSFCSLCSGGGHTEGVCYSAKERARREARLEEIRQEEIDANYENRTMVAQYHQFKSKLKTDKERHRYAIAFEMTKTMYSTRLVTTLLDLVELAESFRICPKCNTLITYDGGCRDLLCMGCGTLWCYECESSWVDCSCK